MSQILVEICDIKKPLVMRTLRANNFKVSTKDADRAYFLTGYI